jgi:hypothetical protein
VSTWRQRAAKSIPGSCSSRFTGSAGQSRPPKSPPRFRTRGIQFRRKYLVVVGASGFEPPTSRSRTLGRPFLQALAGVCKLPIQCSFLHFLNDFQSLRLALGCSRLSPLVARKGQEGQTLPSCWFLIHSSAPPFGIWLRSHNPRPAECVLQQWGSACPGSLGREGRRGWVGK